MLVIILLSYVLGNLNIRRHLHKNSLVVPFVSQINAVHIISFYFFKIKFNICVLI